MNPGMGDPVDDSDVQGGLSEQEKRENVIRCAFGGSHERFDGVLPRARGVRSAGHGRDSARQRGHGPALARRTQPFDADGPGTSDLDVTLVGDAGVLYFVATGFFVPGVHSRPLSDEDPDIAPDLVPLRAAADGDGQRPVNIQASRDVVIRFRGDLLGQPYLTLFAKPEGWRISGPDAEA